MYLMNKDPPCDNDSINLFKKLINKGDENNGFFTN